MKSNDGHSQHEYDNCDSDDDIERTAAFDEQLRAHREPELDSGIDYARIQTIRLLHEVYRAAPALASAMASGDSDHSLMPRSVGRFRILRQIGRGGFGIVYLAEDPLLHRQVALKLIHGHLLQDPDIRSRALREREAMARLQHPNIIPVWEAGEDNDQLFIVSEYCSGQTLAQYLSEHPEPMQGTAAAQWVYRLADAVAHSHQRGVIHRDLKPGNILLEPVQQPRDELPPILEPRLSDFGLAKILDNSPINPASAETRSGLFVGSLEYASPEQVKGIASTIGTRADGYALGVLLYQLLTGRLPHAADSQYDLARCICEVDARFPTELVGSVARDLQAITLRAMARNADDRYPSAAALRDDLGRYLHGQPVEARPVSALEQAVRLARKRPAVTALTSVCCLLATMYLYMLIVSNQRLSIQSQALKVALQHANEQRAEADRQRMRAEDGQNSLNKLLYRESIKLAFDQWQQQNYIGLHDTLKRMSSDLPPTMELRFLEKQLANSYFRFDLQGEPVQALAWHQAKAQLLTISSLRKLRRWHPDRAAPIAEHSVSLGANALAIHPDGKTLALPQFVNAKAKTSNITLWNESDATEQPGKWQSHSTTVESLEYSPDGRWLAAGPRYSNVIVTDLENQDSFALKSNRRNKHVVFSPHSDRIAVNVAVGKIEIYELSSRKLVATITNQLGGELVSFYSLAWVPGHDAIVTSSRIERLQVYSAQDGKRIADVHAGLDAENIAVSSDGRRVVLGDNAGFVRLFDLQALLSSSANHEVTPDGVAITAPMRVLNGKITDMVFINADSFVAADEEGNMMRFSPARPQPKLPLAAPFRQMHWDDNHHLRVYDHLSQADGYVVADGNRLELLACPPPRVEHEAARAANAEHIAMVTFDGNLLIVDSQTGQQVSACQLPAGKSNELTAPVCETLLFSADGQTLFATGDRNTIAAIRVVDGKILWTKDLTNSGYCMAEDASQGTLYLGGGFEAIKILDTKTGELRGEYLGGHGSQCLLLTPQNERLISCHFDGTVRIRKLGSDEPPSIHRVSTASLPAITMSPDHRTLITYDEAGILRMADSEAEPYGSFYRSRLPAARVARLQWSPDGQQLAALIFSPEDQVSELLIFETGSRADGK